MNWTDLVKQICYDLVLPLVTTVGIPALLAYLAPKVSKWLNVPVGEADLAKFEATAQRAAVWAAGEARKRFGEAATRSQFVDLMAAYMKVTIPQLLTKNGVGDVALKLGLDARAATPQVLAPAGTVAVPAPQVSSTGSGLPADPFAQGEGR